MTKKKTKNTSHQNAGATNANTGRRSRNNNNNRGNGRSGVARSTQGNNRADTKQSGQSTYDTKPTKKSVAVQKKEPKPVNPGRDSNGRIPQGRTFSTYDNYLGDSKTGSVKNRTIVAIEVNERNEIAVVSLSGHDGKNRTGLKDYLQGESYYKHYVEIEDNEGNPITPNAKFREHIPDEDVSSSDVEKIRDTVFNHCKPKQRNVKQIEKFRKRK